jgi:hypothetical protein
MSCEKPVNSPFYLDTSTCNNSSNISSSHSKGKRYRYVTVGKNNCKGCGGLVQSRADVSDILARK